MNSTSYTQLGKRLFDAAASLLGLMILSPLFLIVAAAVRLTSPGPALFRQIRTGQCGRRFRILKFRTMKVLPPGAGPLLTSANDARITPTGRWLRKTKIDELPQLFNVLIGDMSLVGPRPEVPRYTSAFTENQRRVLAARPGITGPSIIINEEELIPAGAASQEAFYLSTILPAKLEVDLAYCENIRFVEDVRLILLTLSRIFDPDLRTSTPNEIRHLAGARKSI